MINKILLKSQYIDINKCEKMNSADSTVQWALAVIDIFLDLKFWLDELKEYINNSELLLSREPLNASNVYIDIQISLKIFQISHTKYF